MNTIKWFGTAALIGLCGLLLTAVPRTQAAPQVSVGVNIGAAPDCPYGYYDYEPYQCAPYGYYGPEWFNSGVFVGAGPWFHGHDDFRGHVDSTYDVHRGYKGELPRRGEHADGNRHIDRDFHGKDMRDGRGHDVH